MGSRAEISEALTEVLNKRAKHWALETGFIKRVRKFDGADFAQSLIFGWLQEPDLSPFGTLPGLGTSGGRFERTWALPTLYA